MMPKLKGIKQVDALSRSSFFALNELMLMRSEVGVALTEISRLFEFEVNKGEIKEFDAENFF